MIKETQLPYVKRLTAATIKMHVVDADIILGSYLRRFEKIQQKALGTTFKRISEITGWCAECFYGDLECFHCGGTGYNRDILRQAF